MTKKKSRRLQEKRAARVTVSLLAATQCKQELQKTTKKTIHVYTVPTNGKGVVYAVAVGRVEAAGYVALSMDLIGEPKKISDELAALKKEREELDCRIAEIEARQQAT